VKLLTSGPGASAGVGAISYAGSAAAASTSTTNLAPSTKIRPRGLINSGNMCFANSVLQIILYCPPFHRLFAELGKVLGGVGLSGINGVTSGNGASGEASAYPLVEATVEFLREFVVDDDRSRELKDPKGKGNANINGKIASGSGSGPSSRTSSSRGGKGKERERADSVHDASGGAGAVGRREDDDGGSESFLPTYVYDAMKVKKRFEHMRVSLPLFFFVSSSSVLLSFVRPLSFPFVPFLILSRSHASHDNSHYTGRPPRRRRRILWVLSRHIGRRAFGDVDDCFCFSSVYSCKHKFNECCAWARTRNLALLLAPPAPPPPSAYTESESVVSHEDADGDGWLEVGKRNRTVVTRTVCLFFFSFFFFFFFVSRF
jgi:hypothetical protein